MTASHADPSSFPPGFRWGVATAGYQIEGGAREGGRGASIWDTFAHTPGLTRDGDTGDVACDHYHRWESDLDLLAELGITDYRMSVSWSRLQPTGQGPLNPIAVEFYAAVLAGLRDRGIRPLVTLYHWDLPQPLEDAGGWPNRATAELFADYAIAVVSALGHLADEWVTLNEPWCSSFLGYGNGAHAPGRKDYRDAVAAAHHLNLAHGMALAGIRRTRPGLKVGIANIVTDILPASDSVADQEAAIRLDAVSNRVFLDPLTLGRYSDEVLAALSPLGLDEVIRDGDLELIGAPIDFIGVNYYQRIIARDDRSAEPFGVAESAAQPATTSFGWSVIPESLTAVLLRVQRDFGDLPVLVTENGASFDDVIDPTGGIDDQERVSYLDGYLAAAADAIALGVDLRGYYAWSFLDNFEWAEGYSKRFGIVFVDYATQARTPKRSAQWYRRLIVDHTDLVQSEQSTSNR
jgi:beta-glucosidase